jgi:hypothetical protein
VVDIDCDLGSILQQVASLKDLLEGVDPRSPSAAYIDLPNARPIQFVTFVI